MAIEIGPAVGLCKCGCGGVVFEKTYHYTNVQRQFVKTKQPTRLPGHGRKAARWYGRQDMVPSEPILKLLLRFKSDYGFTWKQLTEMFGFPYPVDQTRGHRYVAKRRVEVILRVTREYIINTRDWRESRI